MAKILVIDDEYLVRITVSTMLQRDGHRIIAASDGALGLAAMREEPADMVITDFLVPNKEGIETIAELRRTYPGLKIIAMSGGARMMDTRYLRVAKQLGADAVLRKPFKSAALWDAVNVRLAADARASAVK